MESTIVKVKCVSKKEKFVGFKSVDPKEEWPRQHEIELEVPYDQNSIFWKMSGGINLHLNTINQEAANMFQLGGEYDVVISPSK